VLLALIDEEIEPTESSVKAKGVICRVMSRSKGIGVV
jgi:hypothetical protein